MKALHVASKWALVLLLLTILAGVHSVFSHVLTQQPVYGGTIIINVSTEPLGLDPTVGTAVAIDIPIYNNVYEGLLKFSGSGDIVMGLAESYDISSDGLEYTFYLRKGVKFHDGHEFTSADVVFTFERNKRVSPHAKTYFAVIDKVEAVGNYTVRFTLSAPDSMFLFNMARDDSIILANGANDEDLKSNPNGTGPFKFVEWVRGDHITEAKFSDYYGVDANGKELPYLDGLTFRYISDPAVQVAALEAGDVDVLWGLGNWSEADRLDALPDFKVAYVRSTGKLILTINNAVEPFDDVRVRRAISYGIDRDEVNQGVYYGKATPIGSHMDPANPYYIDLTWLYPHDQNKARELLAEAGYPNGFSATLELPQPMPTTIAAGEIVADQLKEIGIDLEIEIVEWGQWIERIFTNGDYELTSVNHAEPFDIDIYMSQRNYYFHYNNPWLDEVITKAKFSTDPDEQQRLYGIAQWIIASDAVNGFLLTPPMIVASKEEVMNFWENMPISACDVTQVWMTK